MPNPYLHAQNYLMISRQWTGVCKNERVADYIAHLNNETIPAIKRIEGFISATVFRRELLKGTEFLVTTQWTSMIPIREFAGDSATLAVVPDNVKDMMIQFDEFVRHYEVV